MTTAECAPSCCSDTVTVNTPGVAGNSAVTTTTASFVIPAVGATVTIAVGDTSWLKAKANVFISDGSKWGNFLVAIGSSISITGTFLGFQGDSAAGGSIGSGAIVMPGVGDLTYPNDLDLLTAFTDNSGGTKSDTVAATIARNIITLGPFLMTAVANSQIFEVAVPYAFQVNSVLLRCDIAMTSGGSAAGVFTSRINASNITGGVVSASGAYATGATQAGTAISGANTGTAGQTLEVILSAITAWSAGYGHIEFSVTNTDLAATIAAIAFKANQLRTALRHI